jgi:outer membrane protein assembly factor BamE (lipoprotein component of BamABCDE complex)
MKKSIILLIALLGIIICGYGLRGKITREEFNSYKWQKTNQNNENDWSTRWDMMNSLRNNYNLVGMTKNEIIKLLGKPDNSFSTSNTFRYFLGYAHSGIDTGSLIIEFNNETVKNYIVTKG